MTKILITLVFILFAWGGYAQKKPDSTVYYYENSGRVVSTKKEATYLIAVFKADKNIDKKLFPVKAYYIDGMPLFTTTSTDKEKFIFQGKYIGYYHNGQKLTEKTYDNGTVKGDAIVYYPNGKLYIKITYLPGGVFFLKECRDTTGAILATNGNGKWLDYDDDLDKPKAYGPVVNGLKGGDWHYKINDTIEIVDVYHSGVMAPSAPATGSVSADGKIFTVVEVMPEFPDGLFAFYKYITRNVRYPALAKEHGTQGRVIIAFVVEKDGSLSDCKVVQGIGDGCDGEALRAMQLSPKWKPGMQKGTLVRVAYSIPISFTMVSDGAWYVGKP